MAWDAEEFTMFFNEVYPNLCRFLECILGDMRSAAQDMAQESFFRLYRANFDGKPPQEARFWIFHVARNLALNELSRQETKNRFLVSVRRVLPMGPADPEEQYQRSERRRTLAELLRCLPEHQRAALLLREQEEMSYIEIARVLNASESKVKVDIFRARSRMRAELAELCRRPAGKNEDSAR